MLDSLIWKRILMWDQQDIKLSRLEDLHRSHHLNIHLGLDANHLKVFL